MGRDSLIRIRRGTAAAWTSANPTLDPGEFGFETDTLKLKCGNGSTAWTTLAYIGGTTLSFATPAIVLGSAAAAGSAGTVIRSDGTIAAFDATSPSTQAFGDSAAVGTAAFAARRDHKHAMMANPLIETGGPTTLAFGAVANGEYLTRSGTSIVGGSPTPGGPPTGAAGGDLTGTYPNPTLAAAGGGAAGPTGSATVTPIVTVDAKGRVTALSSVTTVPTNAAGGVLSGNYPNPGFATGAVAGIDGWTDDSARTWTYVSASTFTVTGDQTAIFTPGTRLRFTQTTVKYATVVSSAFSTVTTVTIAVNTDYTLANAAISANSYSYELSPRGYPGWFAWTPAYTGFSADPTSAAGCKFAMIGKLAVVKFGSTADGTSNATTFTITLPLATPNVSGIGVQINVNGSDNSAGLTTPSNATLAANSATLNLFKDIAGNGWTASGTKGVKNFLIQYPYAV